MSAVDPGETLDMRGFQDFSGDLLDALGDLASEFDVPGWAGTLSTAAFAAARKGDGGVAAPSGAGPITSLGPALEACTRL